MCPPASIDSPGVTITGADDTAVRFTPAQLAKAGQPTPEVVLTGVAKPYGHVFDPKGNLWVSNNPACNVLHIPAALLTRSGTVGPANIAATETKNGVLSGPRGSIFDVNGNLLVSSAGNNCVDGYTVQDPTVAPLATAALQNEQGRVVPSESSGVGVRQCELFVGDRHRR